MWPAVAASGAFSVPLLVTGVSLLTGAAGSVDAFNASVPGVEDSVAGVLPLPTARLGLRNRPPNFEDLLPSPSVPSASDVASVLRSFFVPSVLKKDVRRAGLVLSVAVGVAVESKAVAEGSVVAATGVAVLSVVVVLTGSSIWGAVGEVTAAPGSLAGIEGAVSAEGLVGPVVSFLLKKLPKIEALLADLGATSRGVDPVAGSVGEVTAGSAVVLVVPAVPAAAVSPFVALTRPVAVGSEAPAGSTGDPMTRAARQCQLYMGSVRCRNTYQRQPHRKAPRWLTLS